MYVSEYVFSVFTDQLLSTKHSVTAKTMNELGVPLLLSLILWLALPYYRRQWTCKQCSL